MLASCFTARSARFIDSSAWQLRLASLEFITVTAEYAVAQAIQTNTNPNKRIAYFKVRLCDT
jgi:hypothetical protein